ncbi:MULTISPECIES: hypothetical protein [unclassified Kocuria]|uniref:hypothetical protein n=1 Tax=unclassified Kocuria TaxID=2649579 RepID=UPI00064943CA|nr:MULTISPECIES: hypothetical protein [unclassified Kocuria]KLU09401.1 hypothetical protein ABL57_12265 [Kocuria sp. SM24M-10]OLT10202.1 hypothetical protein BJF77_00235 [Kocuria sp. CNJ-770]
MEIIPEGRPLHVLAVLLGMLVGVKAPPESRRSLAGWMLAGVAATAYAALVARDRDRNVQWWLARAAYDREGDWCRCC